jgi:hypothetical protein
VTLEPPSLTIRPGRTGGMGDARAYPAPLKAHPLSGCAKEPFRGGKPPGDGVLALAFRTLLSFQGTSPGCSSATTCGSRFASPPERRGRTTGRSDRQRLPTCPAAYSWWSTTRHVDTFTQKRRPAPDLRGRQDGHRKPSDQLLLALGDLLSSDVDAAGVVPERSSVIEELPCLQLREGSTAFDTVSTRGPLTDTNAHNGSRGIVVPSGAVVAVSSSTTAPGGSVFPGGQRRG